MVKAGKIFSANTKQSLPLPVTSLPLALGATIGSYRKWGIGALGLEALINNAHITVSQIPERCLGCCDLILGTRVRVEWVQHLQDLPHPFISQGPALLTRRLPWIRCLVSQKCHVLSPRTCTFVQMPCFHRDFHRQRGHSPTFLIAPSSRR